jgi:endonuclease/exonuclease/phosphatase family metal-dependent hydrolase
MRSRTVLGSILALGVACAHGAPARAPSAAPLACRSAVAADGAPADVSIAWSVPEDDRAELSAWCAAVGPAVVAPRRTDSSSGSSASERLTIVSWNGHVGGGDLAGLVAALRSGRLTNGRLVTDFVVLVQEAVRAGALVPREPAPGAAYASRIDEHPPAGDRDVVVNARALGLTLYYVPSMRNGHGPGQNGGEDRGNAILSSLPLSEFAAIELPFERQRRVAIAATAHGADRDGRRWRLRVVSAHLDATGGFSRLRVFASGVRTRQARHLAAALDDRRPTVVGADLNTWAGGSRETAYAVLLSEFPDSAAPGWRATSAAGFLVDYVLLRTPEGWLAETRRIDARFGSDHHPLIAELWRDAEAG